MKTLLLTLSLIRNFLFNSPVQSQEVNLEPYCKNGYYEIPGEMVCSRAPNCGGRGYDDVASLPAPNPQACMGDGVAGRSTKGCAGYVPVCCYEVARTGDFTKCVGYWERLWCTKSQCDTAPTKGASDSQCGGNCQCSHANLAYCGAIDPIPLSQRLTGATPANPTPTPTNVPLATNTPTQIPTPTPTSTPTVPSVEPTRPAGSCSPAEIPGLIAPIGGWAPPGKVTITWRGANTARTYALRIDDIGNPWSGDCTNVNPGDLCVNDIPKTTTSYEFTGVEGHTYLFWLHSINACGEWSKPRDNSVTTPPNTSATTCRIQGYRTLVGPVDQASLNRRWAYHIDPVIPNNSLTLWVSDLIKKQQLTVAGVTPNPVYQSNPYYLVVPGDKTYTVSISEIPGYAVSSTYCVNEIHCHINLGANTTLQQGASRTITCPAGGFADLWFNYTPSKLPTLAITPTAAPTTTLIPPTPTACPKIPTLSWRPGAHATRTVVSYDGVDVIETIALHLKQIIESGVTVEVSTDNGATWHQSNSSQNDDHYITIKNRHNQVVTVKARLKNACTQISEMLSEDVQPVPLPSVSVTVAPSVTAAPASQLSRELIIGGSLLLIIVIAAFFVGA